MRDLIVDSVPLRDPLGEWWVDYPGSQMMPLVEREFDSDPPYGFHGNPQTTPGEAYFGTAKETWKLNVIGTDKDDLNLNLRGLVGLLQRPELSVLAAPQRSPLVSAVRYGAAFNVSADAIQYAKMRLVGSVAPEYINESTYRLTCIMENLNGFWQSNPYYTSAQTLMTSTTMVMSLDSTAADSTAPITDGLVRFKGPISVGGSMTLQDRGNPFRAIKYTATVALAATEYVVIDMGTLTSRLQTSNVWTLTTGTDVGARVTTSGDGAFYLLDAPGSNFPAGPWNFTATAIGVGTSSASGVEVRLRKSFIA